MPIRPENKGLYPANWKEVVAAIRERSLDRCEACGVINLHYIERNRTNLMWRYVDAPRVCFSIETYARHYVVSEVKEGWKPPIRVILTVAHLNHDPTDNRPENLRHWCQLHHNQHDAAHRAEGRKQRLAQKEKTS